MISSHQSPNVEVLKPYFKKNFNSQYMNNLFSYGIWGFHGDEDSSRGLLSCDTV